MSKTCLVTGSSGFLGRHLCEYILRYTDWNVIGLDKIHTDITNDRFVQYKIDFTKPSAWPSEHFDYVIHMAAIKDVRKSFIDISTYVETNVMGTANLLEWLKTKKFDKMINFSTAATLGPSKCIPPALMFPDECSNYDPHNPYASTKACQELLGITYANVYDLPIVVARIDTPFGPRQPEDNFVPFVIRKLLYGQDVPLYGRTVSDSFVYSSRFWVYPEEISKSLVKNLEDKDYPTIQHIIGNRYNVRQLLSKIASIMGIMEDTYKVTWVDLEKKSITMDASLAYGLSTGYNYLRIPESEFDKHLAETVNYFVSTYRRQEVELDRVLN